MLPEAFRSGVSSPLFDEVAWLLGIFALLPADAGNISLDLSLARGLDYYTA
jgi:histidyl-tRNA synthetase